VADVTLSPARARRAFADVDIVAVALAVVTVLGVALRFRAYVANRSLWLDESFIALDVIRSSAGQLLGTLDFNQGAAPGFLLLEKGAATLGRQELWLRLPPFLLGLAAVTLMPFVVRRRLSAGASVVALLLFALAPAAVYYTAEMKQYSGDVTSLLAVVLTALIVHEQGRPSRRLTVAASIVGIAAVALSQSAIFAVGGAGAVLVGATLWERRRTQLRAVLIIIAVWAAAALLQLVHTIDTSAGVLASYGLSWDPGAHTSSGSGSGGGGPGHLHLVSILVTGVAEDLGLPTGSGSSGLVFRLAELLVCAGLVALVVRRRVFLMLVLVVPTLLVLVANGVHRYPLSGRTVLLLVPTACILVAEGVMSPFLLLRRRQVAVAVALAVAAAVLLLFEPARTDAREVRRPVTREELRRILPDLAAAKRPGDRLFVVYSAQYALAYYAVRGGVAVPWALGAARGARSQWAPVLRSTPAVTIQPRLVDRDAALEQVRHLPPGRTWVLITHVADARESRFLYGDFLDAFAKRGPRLERLSAPGASAVLFDLAGSRVP
jgi:hypothetical protein